MIDLLVKYLQALSFVKIGRSTVSLLAETGYSGKRNIQKDAHRINRPARTLKCHIYTTGVDNAMEEVSYRPGALLEETVQRIRELRGAAIESVTLERIVMGLFFTGVKLSDGTGGLCFTPIKAIPEAVCCPSSATAMPASGRLKGKLALSFVEDMSSGNPLKKTIGIAVINALSMGCWREKQPDQYSIHTRTDAMDIVEIFDSDYVVVVGALVPALRKLKRRGKPFGILELDTATLKPDELPYHIPQEQASAAVSRADLLIVTGTALINDTLEEILKERKPGSRVVVMGPTASGLPEAFFRRGVSAIGGVIVDDPDRVLDLIAEGGSGFHFFEKGAERIVIQSPDVRHECCC